MYVTNHLKEDEIGNVARWDEPNILYANRRIFKYTKEKDRGSVRTEIRYLSRLLIDCKKRDQTVKTFYDLLHPRKWELMKMSILEMAKFDQSSGYMKVPFPSTELIKILSEMCSIMATYFIWDGGGQEKRENARIKRIDKSRCQHS